MTTTQKIILYGLKHLATLASGLGRRKKLFILIYHRVLDEPDFMRPGEVDKQAFSWQMDLLANYFNVLPLSEAIEKLKNDQLPSRAVSITFDDGYADNYLNALPILQKNNLPATFFIATGYLNGGIMWNDQVIEAIRRLKTATLDLTADGLALFDVSTPEQKVATAHQILNKIKHMDGDKRQAIANSIASQVDSMPADLMLTDEQLIKLHQAGMEIGGHTVTHPILANLDKETVWQEIIENKQSLEKLLKIQLQHFAYPNGKPGQDYRPEQTELIKAAGYQAAVATQWGVVNKDGDFYQLPRFTPWDKTALRFMSRLVYMCIK